MRIVVAEDQLLLRDGLVRLLQGAGHQVVAAVGDAVTLVQAVNRERPDLLLTDVRMPPTYIDDGASAVAFLRSRAPDLPVLVLSQVLEPAIVAMLADTSICAFGYLLKDRVLDIDRFLEQVCVVASGGTAIDPMIVTDYLSRSDDRLTTLTPREIEVLGRVASGRSNAGIAADLTVSSRTVEAHLRSIFCKLDLGDCQESNQRVLAVLRWLRD